MVFPLDPQCLAINRGCSKHLCLGVILIAPHFVGMGCMTTSPNNLMSLAKETVTITRVLPLARWMLETHFEKQVIKHHIKNNGVITSWSGSTYCDDKNQREHKQLCCTHDTSSDLKQERGLDTCPSAKCIAGSV